MTSRPRRVYARSRTTALAGPLETERIPAEPGSVPGPGAGSGGVLRSGLSLLQQLTARVRSASVVEGEFHSLPPLARYRREFRTDVNYHPLVYKYAQLDRRGLETASKVALWEEKYGRKQASCGDTERQEKTPQPPPAQQGDKLRRDGGRPEQLAYGPLYDAYERPSWRPSRRDGGRPAADGAEKERSSTLTGSTASSGDSPATPRWCESAVYEPCSAPPAPLDSRHAGREHRPSPSEPRQQPGQLNKPDIGQEQRADSLQEYRQEARRGSRPDSRKGSLKDAAQEPRQESRHESVTTRVSPAGSGGRRGAELACGSADGEPTLTLLGTDTPHADGAESVLRGGGGGPLPASGVPPSAPPGHRPRPADKDTAERTCHRREDGPSGAARDQSAPQEPGDETHGAPRADSRPAQPAPQELAAVSREQLVSSPRARRRTLPQSNPATKSVSSASEKATLKDRLFSPFSSKKKLTVYNADKKAEDKQEECRRNLSELLVSASGVAAQPVDCTVTELQSKYSDRPRQALQKVNSVDTNMVNDKRKPLNGSLPDEYVLHRTLDKLDKLQIDDGSPASPKDSCRRHDTVDVAQSTDDDETPRRGEKEERKRKLFRFRPSLFSPSKDEASSRPAVTEGVTLRSRPSGSSSGDPPAASKRSSLHLESNNNETRALHAAFDGRHVPVPLQKSASAVIRPSSRDAAARLRLNDYDPTFGVYSRVDPVRSPVTGGAQQTVRSPVTGGAQQTDSGGDAAGVRGGGGVSSRLDDVYFGSASARRYRKIREEAKTRGGRAGAARTTSKVEAALPSVCCGPVLSANRAKLLKANSPFGHVSNYIVIVLVGSYLGHNPGRLSCR